MTTLGLLLLAAALTRLPAPDFQATPVKSVAGKAPVTLRLVSSTANNITDDDAWFEKNGLALDRIDEAPEGLPSRIEDAKFLYAIRSGDRLLGIYGPDYGGGTIVAGPGFAFDFSDYRFAPRHVEGEREFVEQRVLWAEVKGDVLYVAHGHRTYAKSSHGMNAYVTAIDLRGGKALWHSAPLVANAGNFTFLDDGHLVTGYGFTAEPDFLYVLRAKDGAAVAKVPLKSGPSFLLLRGERLYVRTYDRDYVFRVVN
ncbi:MAG TPA: hypothetical protein VEO54_30440 [Thermoanaerobaculia bacterium]|nr:hypothetical protein [Thermoanaerobaculia bacterium]